MTGLVEWLRAALDEAERTARHIIYAAPVVPADLRAVVAHVLRTVQAHREILDRHAPRDVMNNDGVRVVGIECSSCIEGFDRYAEELERVDWPCPDVLSLAGIYRESFPGFDPSWIGES